MESRQIPRVGTRTSIAIVIFLVLVVSVFSNTFWFTGEAQAQGCQPPSCRDEGGGGSGPPQPPPPPDDGGGVQPGGPGRPGGDGGNDGSDGGGDDRGSGDDGRAPGAPPGAPGGGDGDDEHGSRGGRYNSYTCGVIAFCPELADYTTYTPQYGGSGFLLSFTCRTHESCQGSPGEDGDDGNVQPPCAPMVGNGGVEMRCDGDGYAGFHWGYYIKVWADIPPHRVKRAPFPRGMVTVPNEFDLLAEPWISESGGPHFDGTGFFSDKVNMPDPVRGEPEPGDIKEYQIGVRWRRVGDQFPGFGSVPAHCFDFDDRPWNVEAGIPPAACGAPGLDGHVRATHVYETSSWDLPANGPRVDLERQIVPDLWDLESYQVKVPTYWVVEWRDRWYAWEPTGAVDWNDCGCWGSGEPTHEPHRRSCVAPPGICVNPGEWYGQVGDPEYDWGLHDSDWYGIDLRDYGRPAWYEVSYAVISGGEYAGRDWWSGPLQSIPTPIIEVQSVIEP